MAEWLPAEDLEAGDIIALESLAGDPEACEGVRLDALRWAKVTGIHPDRDPSRRTVGVGTAHATGTGGGVRYPFRGQPIFTQRAKAADGG
ncbi:MAG: hypothetical protein GY795_24505 [Desulfobacterales bacterium]|nr:hypothetical protein [Desulfobacterales bacterium]